MVEKISSCDKVATNQMSGLCDGLLLICDKGNLIDEQMENWVERRILFAFSRFESHIERIILVVADENGPKGGIDKACRIEVRLRRMPEIIVNDQDSEISRCVARIVDRAGRSVTRSISRAQQSSRSRFNFLDA